MRLEKFIKNDKELYEQLVFNEETMGMNLGRPFTEEEAEFFFQAVLEQNSEGTDLGFYKVFVGASDKEEYIGMGAITRNEEYEAPEIEYMLLPGFWNKGYGTELVEILLNMVKGASSIVAITDPDNTYSRRILLKKGFESIKQYRNDDGEPAELFLLKRKLEVVTPTPEDLWFRESLMADEETMSYNHAWGGTIPFPEDQWQDWYDYWIVNHENRRYYRYLKDESGFVGEIAYHYDPEYDGYVADVIIFSKFRGRGYGSKGLEILCNAAKENGITVLYDDIAIDNTAISMFLKQGFYEEYRTDEKIVLKKEL